MARAPYQVLILPYRRSGVADWEYAVLRRRDLECWQFIAGGGEGDEAPVEAARREVLEEAGFAAPALLHLDSTASIPASHFDADWGADVLVVPEHAFAVDCGLQELRLSREHSEIRWLGMEEARALLEWDSNKTALWELAERLRRDSSE